MRTFLYRITLWNEQKRNLIQMALKISEQQDDLHVNIKRDITTAVNYYSLNA